VRAGLFSIRQKFRSRRRKYVQFVVALLVSFLVISGIGFAQQTQKQEQRSPMQGGMEEMMKGKKEGDMDGMMRMMKMMNECSRMMESTHSSKDNKDSQK
jgi:hypothetical protein